MSIGYPDFGGIASVNAPVNIYNVSGNGVLPSNSATLGPFNTAGQSYTIKYDPQQGGGGTVPFSIVEVAVVDSANFTTEDITYELPMTTTITDCTYALSGPLNGQQIVVTITNEDTVEMFYNISINGNSTPLSTHTVATQNFSGPIGAFPNLPNFSPRKGLLGLNDRTGLLAGASDNYILMPAPGPISVFVRSLTPADVLSVRIAPLVNQGGFGGVLASLMQRALTDANGDCFFTVNPIRASYNLNITNTGAGAVEYLVQAWFDVSGSGR